MIRRLPPALWIILAAAGTVLAVYGDTLGAGLIWEDYTKLRPAGPSDVVAAFHGSWDPTGRWPAYYRPLSSAYNALVFYFFGLNPAAIHLLSIAGVTLAAVLIGLIARRELHSTAWAAAAAALYAAHPFLLLTAGVWLHLQYQLLASLALLTAVLVWRRQPPASLLGWCPVAVVAATGFLIKEDTILLLPGLVAAQALRARLVRDVPAPTARVMAAAIVFVAGAILIRQQLLGQWGGEELPSLSEAFFNTIRGPMRALGRFRGMFFEETANHLAASAFFAGSVLIGSVLVWRHHTSGRGLWILALVLGAVLNAPLTMLSNNARYHLLVVCAVLAATACLHAIATAARRLPRAVIPAVVAIGVAAMVLATRDSLQSMRPCEPDNLIADRDMLDIASAALPDTMRQWMDERKPRACADGSYADLIHTPEPIIWGQGSARVVALFPLSAESATVEIRDGSGSPGPREIWIYADETFVARMTISQEWSRLPIELERNIWTTLRRAHRVDVSSGPTPGPAALELKITTRPGRTPSGA